MKPDINVIIFDFDGVIINSGADIASSVCYTLKQFGQPLLPRDEIISYVGKGKENLIRMCFKGCTEDIINQAVPIYTDYYLMHCIDETRLYPNVKETLEFFTDKKIALVTNKGEALSYRILDGLGVKHYFKMVIGPETVKNMKPDPEGLLKVLKAFRETPDKAIMVGDSYTDIQAGKSAGIYTCGITGGLGSTDELIKAAPDFVISDMKELMGLIE